MVRLLCIALLFCCFCSCKKDLLHFSKVQKIQSLSDTDRLNKVVFIDDQNGFIVGGRWYVEAIILHTTDGGNTWQRKTFTDVGHLLNSLTVAPDGKLYCIGFEGKMMFSSDTGRNWAFRQLEHYWFRDMAISTSGKATVVGGITFGSGLKVVTDNTGVTYKRDSFNYQMNQINMVNDALGYICGFGVVLKTNDQGVNWNIQNVQDDNFMAMDVHGDEIWMCGSKGSIFHTTDGGNHWARQRNGYDITQRRLQLMDIKFSDRMNGWAVGQDGIVLYSDDGGNHWMEYERFTTNLLTSVAIHKDGTLIVVGDNGTIFRVMP